MKSGGRPIPLSQKTSFISVLLLLTLLISGCVTATDTEGSQEQRQDVIASLEAGQTFRQGFVSRRAGMNQVELFLRVEEDVQASAFVAVDLYRAGGEPNLIAEIEAPLEQLRLDEHLTLALPPVSDSQNGRFEVQVTSQTGGVQVLGRLEDVYAGGEAAVNEDYLLADAAFRLAYDYGPAAVVGDMVNLLKWTWLILPLGAVLILPGWLLLAWSGMDRRLDWGGRAAVILGLSLAAIPTIMAWTSLLNLTWSRTAVTGASGLLAAAAVYRLWLAFKRAPASLRWRLRRTYSILKNSLHRLPSISTALLGVFLITFFVRMVMVRDLSASPWVDSAHHALTTRLILENGTYPDSYTPYLEIDPSGYHPGFHSVLACFLWLSGMDLVEGMLIFGQVLNALAIFPVYLFARLLTRSRLVGLLAALAAGMMTPMPAYFTSWGRYTQLAGLMILPAVLALILSGLNSKARDYRQDAKSAKENSAGDIPSAERASKFTRCDNWRNWIVGGICLAGLSLTHYRVTAFLGCLLLAWGLVEGIRAAAGTEENRRRVIYAVRKGWLPALIIGVLGLGLALPVLLPALRDMLAPKLTAWRPAGRDPFSGITWPYLNTAWGSYILVLAGLGCLWSIARRRSSGLVLLIWTGMLYALANLGSLGLPGSGFVNSISVTISLFLPVSTLAAYLLAEVIQTWREALPWRWRPLYRWGLAAGGLALAVLAARPLLTLLNPVTFMFREADRAGIAWAAKNLPPGETVLVNPFAWGYGQYAGNDGGYWLSALGDHPTMPPPVLYGLSNSTEYLQHINEVSQRVIDLGSDPQALHKLLAEENISYIYIGGRGGAISAHALRSSPLFAQRYTHHGVFIFEVLE